jgi:hypothetical protein
MDMWNAKVEVRKFMNANRGKMPDAIYGKSLIALINDLSHKIHKERDMGAHILRKQARKELVEYSRTIIVQN